MVDFTLGPLVHSTLGFERVFDDVERILNNRPASSLPEDYYVGGGDNINIDIDLGGGGETFNEIMDSINQPDFNINDYVTTNPIGPDVTDNYQDYQNIVDPIIDVAPYVPYVPELPTTPIDFQPYVPDSPTGPINFDENPKGLPTDPNKEY